jgi:hypothetical protein
MRYAPTAWIFIDAGDVRGDVHGYRCMVITVGTVKTMRAMDATHGIDMHRLPPNAAAGLVPARAAWPNAVVEYIVSHCVPRPFSFGPVAGNQPTTAW